MFNAKNILRQVLLAVALAGSAAAAMAGPTNYHVNVNTSGLNGTGSLDFFLSSNVSALPLTATLSNFSSDFGAVDPFYSGVYTDNLDGSFSLTNGSGYNYLSRFLNLGGTVGFDVAFSGAFLDVAGSEGSTFSVALFDQTGSTVGDPSGIAIFDLAATSPTVINVVAERDLADVSVVPEPSTALIMMTGLGLVGFTARRRKVSIAR
jgi:hypothetical protein